LDLEQWIKFYGYFGIIAVLFLTGVGLPPLPEELPVVVAGGMASEGFFLWYLAWPACIVGIMVCDLFLYGIGRFGGRRLFESRLIARFVHPERRGKIEEGFHRHGIKILLTARLVPGIRTGVYMTAGAIHYPWLKFLLADGLYAIPGVGFLFFVSFWSYAWVKDVVLGRIEEVKHILLAMAVLGAIIFALYRYLRFIGKRAKSVDLTPPKLPEILPEAEMLKHPTEILKHPSQLLHPGEHKTNSQQPNQASETPKEEQASH
jgi:membrane protein DedA with SNARE-associated domain